MRPKRFRFGEYPRAGHVPMSELEASMRPKRFRFGEVTTQKAIDTAVALLQ